MNYKGLQAVLFRVKEDHVHVSCVYSLKVLKARSKLFPAAILNLIEIRRAGNERYDDSAITSNLH